MALNQGRVIYFFSFNKLFVNMWKLLVNITKLVVQKFQLHVISIYDVDLCVYVVLHYENFIFTNS